MKKIIVSLIIVAALGSTVVFATDGGEKEKKKEKKEAKAKTKQHKGCTSSCSKAKKATIQ